MRFGNIELCVTPVQNGFIVTLPNMPDYSSLETVELEERGVLDRQKRISKEFEKMKRLKITDLKQENTYIFKTFEEVITFLKDTYK